MKCAAGEFTVDTKRAPMTVSQLAREAVEDYERALKTARCSGHFTAFMRGYFQVALTHHSSLDKSMLTAFLAEADQVRLEARR